MITACEAITVAAVDSTTIGIRPTRDQQEERGVDHLIAQQQCLPAEVS